MDWGKQQIIDLFAVIEAKSQKDQKDA